MVETQEKSDRGVSMKRKHKSVPHNNLTSSVQLCFSIKFFLMEKCHSKYVDAHLIGTKSDTELFALGVQRLQRTGDWEVCPKTGRACRKLEVGTADLYTCKGWNSVYHDC